MRSSHFSASTVLRAILPVACGLALVLLPGCSQNPDHLAAAREDAPPTAHGQRGFEDAPQRRHGARQNEFSDDIRMAGMLGKPGPRAKDIRNQNIWVEVRHIDDRDERFQQLSMIAAFRDQGRNHQTLGAIAQEEDFSNFAGNGFNLGILSENFQSGLFAQEINNREVRVTAQTIGVLNSGTGYIELGEVRATEPIVLRTPGGPVTIEDREFRGASLEVSPEIVDAERELVRVRVRPQLAGYSPRGGIAVSSLESAVIVQNGGMLVIAASPTINNSLAKEILSKEISRDVRNRLVVMRVYY